MSASIYGSDEAERFRLPRIQIVLFFDGFSSPENRVARVFLPGETNKYRAARAMLSHWDFIERKIDTEKCN